MTGCERIGAEELTAWVDGALPDERAERRVAGHVAACPRCTDTVATLRAHKARLARYRAATTPLALPSGLRERMTAALDRVDAAGPHPPAPSPERRGGVSPYQAQRLPNVGRSRRAWVTAALGMLLAVAVALPVSRQILQAPAIPMEALATAPMPPAVTLATNDADQAARWLSAQLGAAIPPVKLSLAGAEIAGAAVDPDSRRGLLLYRGTGGTPIVLHLCLYRAPMPSLPTVRYEGSPYAVAEGNARRATLVVWQADDRTFVAAAHLPAAQLLLYAREMDRHCTPRR